MKYKEINIICVGDIRYRFDGNNINYLDDYENMLRIFFNDGSILEFNKKNLICVEYARGVNVCHSMNL